MSKKPGDRIIRKKSHSTGAGRRPPGASRSSGWYHIYPATDKVQPSNKPWLYIVRALSGYGTGATLASRLVQYVVTAAALAVTTALLVLVRDSIGLLNMGLVYLVVIISATLFAGRRAGILASVLGFILLNYFLVPPYLTFDVTGHNNILALFVFLGASLLISTLISGAREQAEQAQRRAEDVSRLYELSQTIIGARHIDEVLPALARKVRDVFGIEVCWILLPDEKGQLAIRTCYPQDARLPTREEMSEAQWVFRDGIDRGYEGGTQRPRGKTGNGRGITNRSLKDQLQGGNSTFVPLVAAPTGYPRTIGVLVVAGKDDHRSLTPAERTVLATFADQAAVALERLSLLREAARAEVLAHTDELKSALMSAVSHDLRTPLASIMASVTSLLEPDIHWDEETQRDFLQGIYDEAQRLNRLVGNLLDMSRIEGGAIHPEKDWYSIGEVIEAVVQRLEPRAADHPLTVQVEQEIPLLQFDFAQIDQVLTNVLENAINYTPAGTPVKVRAHRIGDNVQIDITDSGPGVSREHLPHLFDKFYQVPVASRAQSEAQNGRLGGDTAGGRQRQKGTGLGLAISKGLVEAHGGRIWASNRRGGGLQVCFTLPVTSSAPVAPPAPDTVTSNGNAGVVPSAALRAGLAGRRDG